MAPIFKRLVANADSLHDGLTAIAEKTGIHPDTLGAVVAEKRETFDFDLADRVLCAASAQHLWWTELADVYYGVDLSHSRCQAPGCERTFIPKVKSGKTMSRYCSKSCKYAAIGMRKGRTARRFRFDLKGENTCWRGHELTPENSKINTDGSRQCRTCYYARQRERRAEKRREALAA